MDASFTTESDEVFRAVFFGLGADGTVGANKNTIKIIGEDPDVHVQAYFVYDSKKSGSQTVSHLRFGPEPIRSTYLVGSAQFVGCHQFQFIEKLDVLKRGRARRDAAAQQPVRPARGLGSPAAIRAGPDHRQGDPRLDDRRGSTWRVTPASASHTNSVLQTCFFAVSGVLPRGKAIEKIKKAIEKTYRAKGAEVVRKNFEAVDRTLAALDEVTVPRQASGDRRLLPIVAAGAPRVRDGCRVGDARRAAATSCR